MGRHISDMLGNVLITPSIFDTPAVWPYAIYGYTTASISGLPGNLQQRKSLDKHG